MNWLFDSFGPPYGTGGIVPPQVAYVVKNLYNNLCSCLRMCACIYLYNVGNAYIMSEIVMKVMHTVLHSRERHLNVVRFLVNEAHCDPHVRDNDGWTPLHCACR